MDRTIQKSVNSSAVIALTDVVWEFYTTLAYDSLS